MKGNLQLRFWRVAILCYWTREIGIWPYIMARNQWYIRFRFIPFGLNFYWEPQKRGDDK